MLRVAEISKHHGQQRKGYRSEGRGRFSAPHPRQYSSCLPSYQPCFYVSTILIFSRSGLRARASCAHLFDAALNLLYAHSKKGYKNGPVQTEMISSYFGGVSRLLLSRYASGTIVLHIRTHIKPIIISSVRFHMICWRHGCHLIAIDLLVPMLFFVHSKGQWA